MGKYILVTGGSGFIGSHLVGSLKPGARPIKCLVRKNSNVERLKDLGVELVCGDLLDGESLKEAVKDVEIVYHLAAQVRPRKILNKRSSFFDSYKDVNISGTKRLAELCLAAGVEKFIYYSSIAAAGVGCALKEEYPCNPITHYGKTKLEAENYLLGLFHSRNFPVVIIRPGQIYGPGSMGMLLLFKLIKKNIFLTIGNGSNTIPLCYIADLIRATLIAEEKARPGSIYFITGRPCTFAELVTAIAIATNARQRRIFIPRNIMHSAVFMKEIFERILNIKICPFCMDISREGVISAVSSCSADLTKSADELGYSPKVGLEEGVETTVKWYKDNGLL